MLTQENLHEYQRFAARFIAEHPQSAIFLSCGLGKTAIALSALQELLFDRFEVSKVLVVCPLRVGLNVWRQECERWEHLRGLKCAIAIGTEQERLAALKSKADLFILNRENVTWYVESSGLFGKMKFDVIILDESSSFKNHQTKRFKALLKLRPMAKRVVLLSATPAANNLMDLWAQFRALDLGKRLGRFIGAFRSEYFIPEKYNGNIVYTYKPKPGADEAIYKKIADVTISMRGADYLNLPELVTNDVRVTMSDSERAAYNKLKDELILLLEDGEITAANAAALSGKLCQMANGAVYGDSGEYHCFHDRKLDSLEDLLEAANGQPVIVAYWFRHDLERISERLRKLYIPFVKLDTAESINRWNRGEMPVALIHPASAGHGLNLQAGGSTLIWFSVTWSLELYEQTVGRLWRQGQTAETVVIHRLITENTIDMQIVKALSEKNKTQASLIEAVKANL